MVRPDPYTIKELSRQGPGYRPCWKRCDSCNNFVDLSIPSNATVLIVNYKVLVRRKNLTNSRIFSS